MNIQQATTEADILKCWEVIKGLRPHLEQSTFVPTILEMISEGYELAYIEAEGMAVAAIGYRYLQLLYCGKHIYIDDLCTLEGARRQGYASRLLTYVIDLGKERGYHRVTLDSGFHRHHAHRLYLNHGFKIDSLHFSKEVF